MELTAPTNDAVIIPWCQFVVNWYRAITIWHVWIAKEEQTRVVERAYESCWGHVCLWEMVAKLSGEEK